MGTTARVTVSLDADLLGEADRLAKRRGQARSSFVAEALRTKVQEERRRLEAERYVEALREQPETTTEIELIDGLGRAALRDLPWDEED